MNAKELTEQALKSIVKDGKVTANYNWQSSNSDTSFIWTFYFLGLTDLYVATKDERLLKVCNDSVDWLFSTADSLSLIHI